MSMHTDQADILIIGSGMAGMTLVRELRKLDGDKSIHMITADDGAQYSKPMLSNAFAQNKSPEQLVQKSGSDWAEDQNVTLWVHTRVTAIDRSAKSVSIRTPHGDDTIGYGQLVMALGASARSYAPEGFGANPLPSINSLSDYRLWRKNLRAQDRVLIVGAGLIGVEFANDLVNAGYSVDVVDPAHQPLGRLLPSEMGQLMKKRLSEAGVSFHLGQSIDHIEGQTAILTDGHAVKYDHVLSAIGLVANTDLAKACGLGVDQGIVVDSFMMTSDPHIYALGDCAQTEAGMLPYIQPLMIEARALAKTLTDDPTPVVLPALPVVVKTPALPTVVCPPPVGAQGHWTIDGEGMDRRAVFEGLGGQTLGFVLMGNATGQRMSLTKEVPDLLAA